MSDFPWREQVETLRGMLNTLEERSTPKDPGSSGLSELKSALDDLRLRAWGLLMAANSEDPHRFQEGFRAHRGIEMCRALSNDLQSGKLSSSQPDLPALGAAARDLTAAVKRATRKPPKRRAKGG